MPSFTMLATLDSNGEVIQETRILSDIAERYAREMPTQYRIIKPVTITVNPPKQVFESQKVEVKIEEVKKPKPCPGGGCK